MNKEYQAPRITVARFKVEEGFQTSFDGTTSSACDDAIHILDESTETVGSGTIYGNADGSWF